MRVPVIYNRTSIRLPSPSGVGTGSGSGGASLLSSLYRWPYLAELLRSGVGGSTLTNANSSAAAALLSNLSASLANLSHSVLNNVSASALNSFGSRSSSSVSSLSRVASSSTHPHHMPTSHHSYGI